MSKIDIKYNSTWTGYKNFRDITNMSITDLAPGSQNVFIHDGEKIEPRAGIDYFGAPGTQGTNINPYWTLANRIHSKYDEFVNVQGTKIPVRIYYSGNLAQGDVMDVWLPIYVGGLPTSNKQWYQITAVSPTTPIISTHRYFFAEWYDKDLFQSEMIFTYGANQIGNWSGGYANIIGLTPNTITTDTTWLAKGFVNAPEGINTIVVNVGGVMTEMVLTAGDFSTNTITVATTAGLNIDDLVFQATYFNDTLGGNTIYDVCSTINNQVYYISWNQRNVYISWNRNQVQNLSPVVYEGSGLNDATFTGPYTGTNLDTVKLTIDSIQPDINIQTFTSGGPGNLDSADYDTSGYSGAAGVTNTYEVIIIADMLFGVPDITLFNIGDTVSGATSLAQGIVVAISPIGIAPAGFLGIKMTTPTIRFESFENVFNLTTAPAVPIAIGTADNTNWFQYVKNGNVVNTNVGFGSFPANYVPANTPVTLSDGLTITFGSPNGTGGVTGHEVGDTWQLEIRTGGIDTFSWALNGVTQASLVPITGAAQALADGISVTFGQVNGHTLGDSWFIFANPTIIRGWSDYRYYQPNRLPGQGFTALLDSNGWTETPQEDKMYVNSQSGHYYVVRLDLSADLLNETVTIERLKSETTNKALFPYLNKYIKNQMAVISQDKTFDILGRQKFLELPQLKSISDEVRVDFETADWEDADILYYKRKIYFCVPRTGLVFVYDEYKKYWHAPMKFSVRVSLLSIIDDMLIGHSYERNESYELFVGLNDLGIYPIETHITLPYDSYGKRYMEKECSAVGFEGYIQGNPIINYTVNADVGGCHGQAIGKIFPFLCAPQDRASLGKSHLGFHGLGNHSVAVMPHFFYIDPFPNLMFYQRNIEIDCVSLDQRWSIISVGTDINLAGINNTSITDPS